MTNFDLKKHIQTYRTEIKIASQNHEYNKVQLKLEESRVEIKKLDHSFFEKEVISYIISNLDSGEWEYAHDWIGSMLYHPSSHYLDYLFKILKSEDEHAPYYWALDVIQYMPEEITDPIIPDLKALADPINPSWTYSDIEKYFEIIVWKDEDAEQFCLSLANSPSELVVQRVNYWLENFEADRLEELEDEE